MSGLTSRSERTTDGKKTALGTLPDQDREPGRSAGSQTLARGLRALELIAGTRDGLTVQDVSDRLAVHRTIAHRLLVTLSEFHLVVRGNGGRFRPASGLVSLAANVQSDLLEVATPHLQRLADTLGCTMSLIIAEGNEAVAIAVIEPVTTSYHLTFRTGSRHSLDRGSAGVALHAAAPAKPEDTADVRRAREQGFAMTFGQVEPGAYGLAAPLCRPAHEPPACINAISYREDLVRDAVEDVLNVARAISEELA